MNDSEKRRILLVAKCMIAVLAAGIAYMLLTIITGFSIPCMLYEITGFYCPGCGLTRFCKALFIFEWEAAARANLLFFLFLPVLLCVLVVKAIQFIRSGKLQFSRLEYFVGFVFVICGIIFAVLRNMDSFSYLQPM